MTRPQWVNDTLFPGFPDPNLRARIERIDLYGPPILEIGGTRVRYGFATVKVTATVVQFPGTADERIVSTRTVRAVINEIPFVGRCRSCDKSFGYQELALGCPNCGSMSVEIESGLELNIKELEVDE